MTPDEVRARLAAGLRVAHTVRNADRPGGLTASRLLGCTSAAARILLAEPEGAENDVYRGARGTWMHAGLADDLASVDPGFTDGRGRRFAWTPGGGLPSITGEYDFLLDQAVCEAKTRPRTECRWHADHGAAPDHSAQVAVAATAKGLTEAFVVYLPTDAGWDEVAICPVDVGHWTTEVRLWLGRADVRAEVDAAVERGTPRQRAVERVLDSVPRDQPVQWCREFCRFAGACRGDYEPPADLEIPDPVMREAAVEAEHWRQVRLDAGRREEAAKSQITHVAGVVHVGPGEVVKVEQQKVEAKGGRRGHVRTKVDRRTG